MAVQLDQQFTSGTGVEPLNQDWLWAQTFTCGLTGVLDSLEFDIYFTASGGTSWKFEIYPIVSGNPDTSNPLGSVTVAYASLPKSRTWFSVDFSASNIALTLGTQYALGLAPIGGDPSPTDGHWYQQTSTGSYAGGNKKISYSSGSWWNYPNDDFNFKTYVEAPVVIQDDITLDSSIAKALYVDSTLQGQVETDTSIDSTLQGNIEDSLGINSSTAYVEDNSRHKVTFEFGQGSPIVETNIDGGRMLARKSRIARIYAILEGTGTTGNDAIIDVNIDGVSVFTDQSYRPTIEMGSSTKYSERRPQTRNIDANSIITVDVDSIPDDAEKLSVVIELNVATSYTHEVREVHLYSGNTLITKDSYVGQNSNQFRLKIIFDEPCNVTYEPTITWAKGTMEANPSIPTGGSWTSTYEANDTYTTPAIDVSDTALYSGSATISISDAKDIFDQDFMDFTFELELLDFSMVEFLESYTNQLSNNSLLINSNTVSRFQYSLDQLSWSSWTSFAPSTVIDLSDVGIGGPASEGTVVLYIRLESVEGVESNVTASIVYSTTVSSVQDLIFVPTRSSGWSMLKWSLPSSAETTPIAKFEIYVDDVLQGEITKIYPINHSLTLDSVSVDDATRTITYAMAAGYMFDSKGNKVSFVGTEEIEVDYPNAASRYDLLGINSSGQLEVIVGVEGISSRKLRPWEREFSGGIGPLQSLPEVPGTPAGFLPLYYIGVNHYSYDDYTQSPEVERHYASIGDNDLYYVAKTRIQYLLNIPRIATTQAVKVKSTSNSEADSLTSKNLDSAIMPAIAYSELQAFSEKAGAGDRILSGDIVTDADVTSNLIYLKFEETDS